MNSVEKSRSDILRFVENLQKISSDSESLKNFLYIGHLMFVGLKWFFFRKLQAFFLIVRNILGKITPKICF